MKTLKIILLIILFVPLTSFSQTDTTKKKYSYVVCDEFKKDCKSGNIITNKQTAIADTIVAFLSGKVVDNKNEGLPFATITLTNNISKTKNSCTTDLSGNYKLTLNAGQYTFKTVAFCFIPFTFDSLTLGTGDIHTLNVDIGEYCCLKTKKILSNTPLQDAVEPIEIKKK